METRVNARSAEDGTDQLKSCQGRRLPLQLRFVSSLLLPGHNDRRGGIGYNQTCDNASDVLPRKKKRLAFINMWRKSPIVLMLSCDISFFYPFFLWPGWRSVQSLKEDVSLSLSPALSLLHQPPLTYWFLQTPTCLSTDAFPSLQLYPPLSKSSKGLFHPIKNNPFYRSVSLSLFACLSISPFFTLLRTQISL